MDDTGKTLDEKGSLTVSNLNPKIIEVEKVANLITIFEDDYDVASIVNSSS